MRANDLNYIKRLKSRKEDALEFVVDKYLPLVKGVIYKVLSSTYNETAIEECINDVFLSVWENISKFNGDDNDFKRWICAIAKYIAIDYYRKAMKNLDIAVEKVEEGKKSSVEEEVIIKEDKNELMELINTLEPMDRDIFIMKFFLGERNEDIARKYNVSKAAIDNRIYRGKKRVREGRDKLGMEA